jgi:hypothetical protein
MKTLVLWSALALGALVPAFAGPAASPPTARFDDLYAAPSVRTDLTVRNESRLRNRCSLTLDRADGSSLATTVAFTLRARERRVLDLFAGVVEPADGLVAAAASLACERPFAAHAVRVDLATASSVRLEPALRAAAAATAGATLPACPAAADCFDAPGVVFVPTPSNPDGRVSFPAPIGTATRFKLSMNVTVADWFAPEPHGKHLIYWFVIDRNFFMPGMLYFRGPAKNEAFARHGVGLTHPEKIKIIKPFAAEVGHTYNVVHDYDMARGLIKITVKDLAGGGAKATLRGKPNVDSFKLKSGSKLLVDMGFVPDLTPTEVPSFGWTYSDVHLEAYVSGSNR